MALVSWGVLLKLSVARGAIKDGYLALIAPYKVNLN